MVPSYVDQAVDDLCVAGQLINQTLLLVGMVVDESLHHDNAQTGYFVMA